MDRSNVTVWKSACRQGRNRPDSEIRHATKLIEKYGDGTDGADLWFVKGAGA